ncbi:gliding motility-associated C-terminal domain-containing protein [Dyadobacter subterraneus]|uniref:Gliding motility-associated C-terminal domain-containing protein n=1 Tax=Dyadobacter subterraneus TaxID=2773304 RepID=A0ABR9WR87_9BACT|nr:gliding motility-associated C-terminal domain-containing protein [Dyadobacter subterraneus]MBE9466609.1 gliding motility-associated C-terminal domain-containing protein [Dyadobacter subterraneus]
MGKILFLTELIFCLPFAVFGQKVDCGNIGFEEGSTNGWILTNGTVENVGTSVVYTNETVGIYANGHLVTKTSDGNDPKITAEAIPMVAPGSSYSLRIGNTLMGSRFDRAKTSFVVGPDNTLFQYKFAILLENPTNDHQPYQKPGFNIRIYDASGNDISCSNYDIQLEENNTVDGFKTQGDIQYRNWTTGAMDLRDHIGETITVEVTAHGCTKKKHFGYAYFDAQCTKSEVRQAASCPDEEGYLTLVAPNGFGKYTWSNGVTTSETKVTANLGDKYSVKLVPVGSLDESCELQMDYTIEFKQSDSTIVKTICEGESVAVGDTTYKTSGNFIRHITRSNVCDSTVHLSLTVNPVAKYSQSITICEGDSLAVGDTLYRTAGTYVNVLSTKLGCDSTVTTELKVDQLNLASMQNLYITQGDSVQLHAVVDPAGSYNYIWQPPASLVCPNCPDAWAKPASTTLYTLKVSDVNQICSRDGRVTVEVRPCGIYPPTAFSPNHDGDNDVFFVYGNSCVSRVRKMVIYNRWGEVIYMKENFAASEPSNGWDGNYKGQPTEPGVYPYKIKVEFKSGELVDYRGIVTLVK